MNIPLPPSDSRLVYLKDDPDDRRRIVVQCQCGETRSILRYNFRLQRSCGCLQRERASSMNRVHGQSRTRLHKIWQNMRGRCSQTNRPDYRHYGGRGIQACAEWDDFSAFARWARANGYAKNLTLDRIDTDGDYSPSNCRWRTREQQTRNRRVTVRVKFQGKWVTVPEAAQALGWNNDRIYWRLRRGDDPATTLEEF